MNPGKKKIVDCLAAIAILRARRPKNNLSLNLVEFSNSRKYTNRIIKDAKKTSTRFMPAACKVNGEERKTITPMCDINELFVNWVAIL